MADYGRITIQNGKNYFYDDKTKKLGKEVQLKVGDTALDRNGNRNMWNGTTWISTKGGAVASKLTKKQNGSFTYYGRNDGTGYWKDSAGRRLAEDNILKIGNGNYKRLNPNGSQTILMENGQFTEEGNKLSELFKDNMRKGNVYDVRVSEVNGQKYSKARDIRTDQGEYNLARNIRVGWRNDTDFNTKQESVNTIGNKEKAERERLNREALNIKPQLNWLQQAKSNSSKRIEEVAKAKEFENFINNELSKDTRAGTGELLSEPTKIDYTTPFKDQYSPESFFEQPAAVGDKDLKLNKAIQKYAEIKGVDSLQKALKGQETINTSKTLDRSATQLAQTGVGLMAATVAAPYIINPTTLNMGKYMLQGELLNQVGKNTAKLLGASDKTANTIGLATSFVGTPGLNALIDRGVKKGVSSYFNYVSKTLPKEDIERLASKQSDIVENTIIPYFNSRLLNAPNNRALLERYLGEATLPIIVSEAPETISKGITGNSIGQNISNLTGIDKKYADMLGMGISLYTGNRLLNRTATRFYTEAGGAQGGQEAINHVLFGQKNPSSRNYKNAARRVVKDLGYILSPFNDRTKFPVVNGKEINTHLFSNTGGYNNIHLVNNGSASIQHYDTGEGLTHRGAGNYQNGNARGDYENGFTRELYFLADSPITPEQKLSVELGKKHGYGDRYANNSVMMIGGTGNPSLTGSYIRLKGPDGKYKYEPTVINGEINPNVYKVFNYNAPKTPFTLQGEKVNFNPPMQVNSNAKSGISFSRRQKPVNQQGEPILLHDVTDKSATAADITGHFELPIYDRPNGKKQIYNIDYNGTGSASTKFQPNSDSPKDRMIAFLKTQFGTTTKNTINTSRAAEVITDGYYTGTVGPIKNAMQKKLEAEEAIRKARAKLQNENLKSSEIKKYTEGINQNKEFIKKMNEILHGYNDNILKRTLLFSGDKSYSKMPIPLEKDLVKIYPEEQLQLVPNFKQGNKLNKLRELKRRGVLNPIKKVDWEEYQKQNRKWKN